MAITYLTRTQTTGNRTTFTWSGWVKKNDTSSSDKFLTSCGTASNFRTQFFFDGSDRLQFYNDDGGSNNMNILTTRVFRDTNAWYHIVLRFDTTQATASDRIRFYVNGVQETVLTNTTYPTQNADNTQFNYNGVAVDIGRRFYNNTNHWNGSMSHVHFCDGQSYGPDSFGSTDATTGEWKINTSPSVTYGNNGFFILKDGNSVTDQSGNGNNFTVGDGTVTNTEDCPSNVFATWNPLYNYVAGVSFSNGNTQYKSTETVTGPQSSAPATIAVSSGKYYAEILLATFGGANPHIGVCPVNLTSAPYWGEPTSSIPMITHGVNYNSASGVVTVTNTSQGTFPTFTSGDYIGIALDMDNERVYFSKNGTWINSANPSSGTGYFDFSSVRTDTNEAWVIGAGAYGGTIWRANFGNGYFGTTAVASAGTNASGIGIFEYDVPTGYTALSTKGLNL